MKINCKPCLRGDCNDCTNEDCLCREEHSRRELEKAFTDSFNSTMPQTFAELKESLRKCEQWDIEQSKSVVVDNEEFKKDTKGGFYAYEEANVEQRFAKDFVSDILLPAHVFNGKESCGAWKISGCLQNDLHEHGGGFIQKSIMRCNNKGCKVCATSSIKREAKAITDRLMTFCNLKKNRKVYLGSKNRSRVLSHVVVSIPYEEQSLYLEKGDQKEKIDGRWTLRKKAIKLLKQFDIDGGVMVDHPYRFSKGLESARFSPHLHFILTGWIDGKITKEIYKKTGWIISQISTMDSWQGTYSLSKYLLSHSAVFLKEEGKRSAEHSVRYFGECHNKKFKVEDVLKYSITGYDQIESIILNRKELTKKGVDYSLQSVVYTHSIIEDSIKDVQEEYFEEYVNGNPLAFSKSLKRFVSTTKDNPAISQSDLFSQEQKPFEFLQMRFDYGKSQFDIVQSVYVNIVFDHNLDDLCPECTSKMLTITPPDSGWSDKQSQMMSDLLKELPEGVTIPIDDVSQFDYLRNTRITHLGMPYFDLDGALQYDSGIYGRPDCLDSLNPKLYWAIIKNINSQKAKFSFKLQNGRCPTFEELQESLKVQKPVKSENESLLNW